ncbi:MAG: hypothetical protein RSF40_01585 [Oscillospiraceae bacterium]
MNIRKLTMEERMSEIFRKHPSDYEFYDEDNQTLFLADDTREYYSCNNCGLHYLNTKTVHGECPNCKNNNTSFEELTVEEIYNRNCLAN